MSVISCVMSYSALSLNFVLGELHFRKAIYYYNYIIISVFLYCDTCVISLHFVLRDKTIFCAGRLDEHSIITQTYTIFHVSPKPKVYRPKQKDEEEGTTTVFRVRPHEGGENHGRWHTLNLTFSINHSNCYIQMKTLAHLSESRLCTQANIYAPIFLERFDNSQRKLHAFTYQHKRSKHIHEVHFTISPHNTIPMFGESLWWRKLLRYHKTLLCFVCFIA